MASCERRTISDSGTPWCSEAARQQIVDGNVLVCYATCNAGNESSKSRACRTRQIEPGKRHFDAEGCDVHDSAESTRRHSIDHFLDEFNGGHHIHGDSGQQRLPIQISEVPEGWATVIIDENIRRRACREQKRLSFGGCDVREYRCHVHLRRQPNFLGGPFKQCSIAPVDYHRSSRLGERKCATPS
jgi:hypothetical protein